MATALLQGLQALRTKAIVHRSQDAYAAEVGLVKACSATPLGPSVVESTSSSLAFFPKHVTAPYHPEAQRGRSVVVVSHPPSGRRVWKHAERRPSDDVVGVNAIGDPDWQLR